MVNNLRIFAYFKSFIGEWRKQHLPNKNFPCSKCFFITRYYFFFILGTHSKSSNTSTCHTNSNNEALESVLSSQKSAQSTHAPALSTQESALSTQESALSSQKSTLTSQESVESSQESALSRKESVTYSQESALTSQESAQSSQESVGYGHKNILNKLLSFFRSMKTSCYSILTLKSFLKQKKKNKYSHLRRSRRLQGLPPEIVEELKRARRRRRIERQIRAGNTEDTILDDDEPDEDDEELIEAIISEKEADDDSENFLYSLFSWPARMICWLYSYLKADPEAATLEPAKTDSIAASDDEEDFIQHELSTRADKCPAVVETKKSVSIISGLLGVLKLKGLLMKKKSPYSHLRRSRRLQGLPPEIVEELKRARRRRRIERQISAGNTEDTILDDDEPDEDDEELIEAIISEKEAEEENDSENIFISLFSLPVRIFLWLSSYFQAVNHELAKTSSFAASDDEEDFIQHELSTRSEKSHVATVETKKSFSIISGLLGVLKLKGLLTKKRSPFSHLRRSRRLQGLPPEIVEELKRARRRRRIERQISAGNTEDTILDDDEPDEDDEELIEAIISEKEAEVDDDSEKLELLRDIFYSLCSLPTRLFSWILSYFQADSETSILKPAKIASFAASDDEEDFIQHELSTRAGKSPAAVETKKSVSIISGLLGVLRLKGLLMKKKNKYSHLRRSRRLQGLPPEIVEELKRARRRRRIERQISAGNTDDTILDDDEPDEDDEELIEAIISEKEAEAENDLDDIGLLALGSVIFGLPFKVLDWMFPLEEEAEQHQEVYFQEEMKVLDTNLESPNVWIDENEDNLVELQTSPSYEAYDAQDGGWEWLMNLPFRVLRQFGRLTKRRKSVRFSSEDTVLGEDVLGSISNCTDDEDEIGKEKISSQQSSSSTLSSRLFGLFSLKSLLSADLSGSGPGSLRRSRRLEGLPPEVVNQLKIARRQRRLQRQAILGGKEIIDNDDDSDEDDAELLEEILTGKNSVVAPNAGKSENFWLIPPITWFYSLFTWFSGTRSGDDKKTALIVDQTDIKDDDRQSTYSIHGKFSLKNILSQFVVRYSDLRRSRRLAGLPPEVYGKLKQARRRRRMERRAVKGHVDTELSDDDDDRSDVDDNELIEEILREQNAEVPASATDSILGRSFLTIWNLPFAIYGWCLRLLSSFQRSSGDSKSLKQSAEFTNDQNDKRQGREGDALKDLNFSATDFDAKAEKSVQSSLYQRLAYLAHLPAILFNTVVRFFTELQSYEIINRRIVAKRSRNIASDGLADLDLIDNDGAANNSGQKVANVSSISQIFALPILALHRVFAPSKYHEAARIQGGKDGASVEDSVAASREREVIDSFYYNFNQSGLNSFFWQESSNLQNNDSRPSQPMGFGLERSGGIQDETEKLQSGRFEAMSNFPWSFLSFMAMLPLTFAERTKAGLKQVFVGEREVGEKILDKTRRRKCCLLLLPLLLAFLLLFIIYHQTDDDNSPGGTAWAQLKDFSQWMKHRIVSVWEMVLILSNQVFQSLRSNLSSLTGQLLKVFDWNPLGSVGKLIEPVQTAASQFFSSSLLSVSNFFIACKNILLDSIYGLGQIFIWLITKLKETNFDLVFQNTGAFIKTIFSTPATTMASGCEKFIASVVYLVEGISNGLGAGFCLISASTKDLLTNLSTGIQTVFYSIANGLVGILYSAQDSFSSAGWTAVDAASQSMKSSSKIISSFGAAAREMFGRGVAAGQLGLCSSWEGAGAILQEGTVIVSGWSHSILHSCNSSLSMMFSQAWIFGANSLTYFWNLTVGLGDWMLLMGSWIYGCLLNTLTALCNSGEAGWAFACNLPGTLWTRLVSGCSHAGSGLWSILSGAWLYSANFTFWPGKPKSSPLAGLEPEYDLIVDRVINSEKFIKALEEIATQQEGLKSDLPAFKEVGDLEAAFNANLDTKFSKFMSEIDDLKVQLRTELTDGARMNQLAVEDLQSKLRSLADDLKSQEGLRESLMKNAASSDTSALIDQTSLKIEQLADQLKSLETLLTSCCANKIPIEDTISRLINNTLMAADYQEGLIALLGKHFVSQTDVTTILDHIEQTKTEALEARANQDQGSNAHVNYSEALVENLLKEIEERRRRQEVAGGLAEQDVAKLVENALIQYDADKTGLFDFALETAGGSVVSTRCTETYVQKSGMYSLFGIPIWYPSNNPRTIIQPGVLPGECWAFKGSAGYIVIQLSEPIRPNQFSLEHISKSMSPSGRIDSAPKEFSVLGLMSEKDKEPVLLGEYVYLEEGSPLQFFPVETSPEAAFPYIELDVKSNHGNVNYTCIYRFRVHGTRS